MKTSQFTILCLLLTSQVYSSGYTFSDSTKKSTSTLNGYSGNTVKRKNVPSGGSGGMPVSKFGAQPQSHGGYKNLGSMGSGNKNVVTNPNAQAQMGNNSTMNQIMNLLQSQPQLMNNFQTTMSSGNAQQKNLLLTTLMGLIGGNSSQAQPAAPQMPAHCSAPKYKSVMNAVKGINMSKRKALQHDSLEKISFVYFKKTEEVNFLGYKLVFKFQNGSKVSFVLADFSIPKISGSHLKFTNYLITSNTNILSSIVNETDFSINNTIQCMDLKIMFNGGVKGHSTQSAFGGNVSSAIGRQNMMGGNNMMGNNMMRNNMMGNNMMGNNMMGGNMMGGNMMGNNMMRNNMMGNNMMGGNMMRNNNMMGGNMVGSSMMGGGMGYKAPKSGTFMTNQ